MTPFSITLKDIRNFRELKQKECADILGWEPSYLSALETGNRPPPKTKGLNCIVKRLSLTDLEAKELYLAADQSREVLRVPKKIGLKQRETLLRFTECLPILTNQQIEIISLTLNICRTQAMEAPKM